MTVIGPSTGFYAPNDSIFSYTDHSGVTVDAAKARFLRPLAALSFQHAAPGSRVRFRSDAPAIKLRLQHNNLVPAGAYNDVFSVLVNDQWHADYNPTDLAAVYDYDIDLTFATRDFRTIEIIFPYAAGFDFRGIQQDQRYRVMPCLARPAGKVLCIGDSISQQFYAAKSVNGYAFLLAQALKKQLVNMGYSSGTLESHAGATYAGAIAPEIVTVMLGYNDHTAQISEATFKSRYQTLMNNLLTTTDAQIYAITPIWTNVALTIPVATYRTWIGQVVAALANSRITIVNGLTLCTNSTAHLPDGIHPNDAGNAAIAAALAAAIPH